MARLPAVLVQVQAGVIMGTVISAVASTPVSGDTVASSDGRQIDGENTGYRSPPSSEVLKTKHSSATEVLESRHVDTIPCLKFVFKV